MKARLQRLFDRKTQLENERTSLQATLGWAQADEITAARLA